LIGAPMHRCSGFFCFHRGRRGDEPRAVRPGEAESELVAGFHTEYASFKFAMFFMAEYSSMITVSCLGGDPFLRRMALAFPQTDYGSGPAIFLPPRSHSRVSR